MVGLLDNKEDGEFSPILHMVIYVYMERLEKVWWLVVCLTIVVFVIGIVHVKTARDEPVRQTEHVSPSIQAESTQYMEQVESSSQNPEMRELISRICDLDHDGDCDDVDQQIFDDSEGTCFGDPGYNPEADIDFDGCITSSDRYNLFPPVTITP